MPSARASPAMAPRESAKLSTRAGRPVSRTSAAMLTPSSAKRVPTASSPSPLLQPATPVTVPSVSKRSMRARSAPESRPTSRVTASKTRAGGSACATSVATRRKRRLLLDKSTQVAFAGLERARHRVERALERSDLADVVLGHARAQIAAGELVGHLGGSAERPDDDPRQIAREDDDQENRSRNADGGCDGRTTCRVLCAGFALVEKRASRRGEPFELRSQRVDLSPALLGSGDATCGGVVSSHGAHERHRVRVDVRPRRLDDSPCLGQLAGVVGREPLELPRLRGKGGARGAPRVEEALVARDHEPAHTCFEVDDELLDVVGAYELLSSLAPQVRRCAQLVDREQQSRRRPRRSESQAVRSRRPCGA